MKRNEKKNWYPLDNAAKIYPPITNETSPYVFSLSAIVKEDVDPELLKRAVETVLKKTPTFKTKLKRGLFWYFLEQNDKPVVVSVQPPHYIRQILPSNSNGYMFEVFYSGNRITINFHHSITDGTGATNFLLETLMEYFRLCGYPIKNDGEIRPAVAPYVVGQSEDNFMTYDKGVQSVSPKDKHAFRYNGTPFDHDGCGIITAVCPIEQIKQLAKKYDTTITVYLAALYAHVIYEQFIKGRPIKNKRVNILMPINLRKQFSSDTVRNFTLFIRLKHDYEKPVSFDELVELFKKQKDEGMQREFIERMIHFNVKLEKNFFMKLVPLFIKDIAMRISYNYVGEKLQSGDISNLGLLKTPEGFSEYLKAVTFLIGPTKNAKQNLGVVGYDGKLFITSARGYVENTFERAFFSKLASLGVDITLQSNYWEADL